MENKPNNIFQAALSRRTLLAAGCVTMAGLAGCASTSNGGQATKPKPLPTPTIPYRQGEVVVGAEAVNVIAFAPQGTQLAVGGYLSIGIEDPLSSSAPYRSYEKHTQEVLTLAWSPDAQRLASGGRDNQIYVCTVPTQGDLQTALTYTGHQGAISSLAWSPDGKRLASSSDDGTVKIWDTSRDNALIKSINVGGGIDRVVASSLSWSSDGKLLVFNVGIGIGICETKTFTPVGALNNNTAAPDTQVDSAAISPDGNYIASGWDLHALLVWETHNQKKTAQYYKTSDEGIRALAWSPNSRYLITGGNGGIVEIWDVQSQSLTPTPVYTYTGHTSDIESVSWATNGWCVASLDSKNKVIVWRAV